MTERQLAHIRQHPDFQALIARRTRLGWTLTALMLSVYFGFILLLAFFPALLGTSLAGGAMTAGIPAGAAIIVIAFVLTAFYVRKANRELDPLNAKVLKECEA